MYNYVSNYKTPDAPDVPLLFNLSYVLALQIVSTLAMSTASRIIKEKQLPAHFVSV